MTCCIFKLCECVSPFNFRELQSNCTESLSSMTLDESKSGENAEKEKQKKRVKNVIIYC